MQIGLSRHCRGLRANVFFRGRHHLNFLQLSSLKPEVLRHLNDLARTNKIFRVRTEALHSRTELAATHAFGYLKTELALSITLVVHTEFTNYHYQSFGRYQLR